MSHVVAKLNKCGVIKAYFNTLMIEQEMIDVQCNLEPFDKNLQWDRGNLIDVETSKNYLYFHFHFLKKDADFILPLWQEIPSNFYISKKGFAATEHT